MTVRHIKSISLVAIAVAASFSLSAQELDNAEIETVVVTAQKRVQSIQDVPMTMSALGAQTLDDLGIDRFDALSDFIPGLVVQQQSINNNGYVIRGITSDDGSSSASARVSVYLNGTDVSRSRGSYFETYDMERIEVVKGPQATLFGTAASIGAMSFITAKPEEDFSAKLKLGAGNYGMFSLEGMVTGGNELVQGRLAFVSKERDGYVKNTAEHDLNGYDRLAYRGSLRFSPSEDLIIDIVFNHDEASDPGTAFATESVLFSNDGAFSVPDDSNLGLKDLGIEREVNDINATIEWVISESFSYTYIGAYRDYDSLETFDADGTQYEFLNFAEDAYGDQSSNEMRINYTSAKLNGFVGLSYFKENGTQSVPYTGEEGLFVSCVGLLATSGIPGCYTGTTALLSGGLLTEVWNQGIALENHAENASTSIFADASYLLTPDLEVTAGLRYVKESRETTEYAYTPTTTLISGLLGVPASIFFTAIDETNGNAYTAEADDNVLLPRLNAIYTVNENMSAYATYSKGQRSQVVQLSGSEVDIVPAEKINNLEAGLKGSNDAGTLSYSAAIFLQDYENFQVSVFDSDTGITESFNAGQATNLGFETEMTWNLTRDLKLLANIALIDAGIEDDAANGDYAGNQFRLQPETSGAIGYVYNTEIGSALNFFTSGSFTYRSSVYFDIENMYEEGAVELVNLRIGVGALDDNWSTTLAVTNLLDKEYIMDAGNTGGSFGYPTYIEGAPRMISLSVTKRFGAF